MYFFCKNIIPSQLSEKYTYVGVYISSANTINCVTAALDEVDIVALRLAGAELYEIIDKGPLSIYVDDIRLKAIAGSKPISVTGMSIVRAYHALKQHIECGHEMP